MWNIYLGLYSWKSILALAVLWQTPKSPTKFNKVIKQFHDTEVKAIGLLLLSPEGLSFFWGEGGDGGGFERVWHIAYLQLGDEDFCEWETADQQISSGWMELQSLAELLYLVFADGSTEVGGGSGGARTPPEPREASWWAAVGGKSHRGWYQDCPFIF